MTHGEHIPQEELALYAMQALLPQEYAAVQRHVEECAVCRGELAGVTGDLALVALSAEQHPIPEGARQRFLDRISVSPAAPQRNTMATVVPIDNRRPVRTAMIWLPWVAVAALIFVAISLGIRVNTLNEELRRESAQEAMQAALSSHAQEVLDVLTAPSAQRVLLISAKTKALPTGRVVYLAERGGLIFEANNLESLPGNKTYELWVIPMNGKAPIPAGLFRPDASGNAGVVLPQLPKGVPAKAFGVTVEKAEGSDTPTAPIILSGAAATVGE